MRSYQQRGKQMSETGDLARATDRLSTTGRSAPGLPAPLARQGRPKLAWRPVLIIAAIIAAVHLAVAARYGWHRDEFYYVITGRHLAWGYVDQPPLAPLLARLAAALPAGVLPLRILAIACQVGCILLA